MGPRPCPWASCRHHLYLEVHAESGELLSAHREIDDLPETCSLDVAERGDPLMLEEVGELLNVTRERVRQLEEQGMVHLVRELKRAGYDLDELVRDE